MNVERDTRHPARWMNRARFAVVLGSGLSMLADLLEPVLVRPYTAVPGLAPPSVPGHHGRFVLTRAGGGQVLICAGRHHVYEGFDLAGAVVTAAAELGCRSIILTQAAGGLHRRLPVGAWLVPRDVVSLPTRGGGAHRPGLYGCLERDARRRKALIDDRLRIALEGAALRSGVPTYGGTLFWTPGPCYETPAEARAARALGADAANMSCLPELLAASRAGIRAACLSVITNRTANCSPDRTDHEEIVRMGKQAVASLALIIAELATVVG